jgi:hypothetical protein
MAKQEGGGSHQEGAEECACGHCYGLNNGNPSLDEGSGSGGRSQRSSNSETPVTSLDASFVHLPPSLLLLQEESRSPRANMQQAQQLKPSAGYLDSFKHLTQLELAANSVARPPQLCLECVQRYVRSVAIVSSRSATCH